MAKSFDELVKEGRDQGLDRAKAEARARDLFYGDPPPQATRLREPPPSVPEAFASVDELWAHLQATWESRSTGTELVDVLESINELLDRGVISQEQFREVMRRTREQQKEPTLVLTEKQKRQQQPKKAARIGVAPAAPVPPSTRAPAPAPAAGDVPASAADDRVSAEAFMRSVLLLQLGLAR